MDRSERDNTARLFDDINNPGVDRIVDIETRPIRRQRDAYRQVAIENQRELDAAALELARRDVKDAATEPTRKRRRLRAV